MSHEEFQAFRKSLLKNRHCKGVEPQPWHSGRLAEKKVAPLSSGRPMLQLWFLRSANKGKDTEGLGGIYSGGGGCESMLG